MLALVVLIVSINIAQYECLQGNVAAVTAIQSAGGNVSLDGDISVDDPIVAASSDCETYRLSGAYYKTAQQGTYYKLSSNTCNGRPAYRMYNSGLGKYMYLYNSYYYTTGSRWYFSDTVCGTRVHIRSSDTGHSRPRYVRGWEEWNGVKWARNYGMTLTCSSGNIACYSCSGYGSACVTTQFSSHDPMTYCDVGRGYFCWQSYTTDTYGRTRVSRACKYGCPSSSSYYSCSSTCYSGTCSKCCSTNLCNRDSMSGGVAGLLVNCDKSSEEGQDSSSEEDNGASSEERYYRGSSAIYSATWGLVLLLVTVPLCRN